MLLAVEWGRIGGCEQKGKVAKAKRGEKDLPQGDGAPRQGGRGRTRNSFWLNLSGIVTWGWYDEIGPEWHNAWLRRWMDDMVNGWHGPWSWLDDMVNGWHGKCELMSGWMDDKVTGWDGELMTGWHKWMAWTMMVNRWHGEQMTR